MLDPGSEFREFREFRELKCGVKEKECEIL
jgi:hypothetical protein